MPLSSQIAAELLDIKAVYLKPEDPFTWASGIKSPIYTDNELPYHTLKHVPSLKMALLKQLKRIIQRLK